MRFEFLEDLYKYDFKTQKLNIIIKTSQFLNVIIYKSVIA